eukprot:jgi/Ulvmu1/2224/UM013_0071.1
MACVSCGMAILMHLRNDLRTEPDPDAVGPTGAPVVGTPQLPPEPPKQQDWRRLVSVLLRLSPDWFSEARAMTEDDFEERLVALLRSPQVDVRQNQAVVQAVVKFNHSILCSSRDWDSYLGLDQGWQPEGLAAATLVLTAGSKRLKTGGCWAGQRVVRAGAGTWAQCVNVNVVAQKKKIKMPGKREDWTRIYESKRWQRAGKDLLRTFLLEPEPAPFTPKREERPARL